MRPFVARAAATNPDWDRVLGYAMSSFGLFYGILLALIAVSVYENFQRVNAISLDEVSHDRDAVPQLRGVPAA